MHLTPLIQDLAVILGVAAIVTFIFQRIKQPVVIGYIIAGILVGPHTLSFVSDLPNIQVWAEIGVIFLMFSIGLEFNFKRLLRVGGSSIATAGLETGFMIITGILIGRFLKWSLTESILLGTMISISSTTIIFKTLEDLKLKSRQFAEKIMNILIVEDLLAILILVGVSSIAASNSLSGSTLLFSLGKLILVVVSWFLVGYFIVPNFVRVIGKLGNDELLTVLSIGLCLSLAALGAHFQYPAALGAFIMGSILSETSELPRIEIIIKPLKNLFTAVFFVSVGILIDPHAVSNNLNLICFLSAVVIIGKITWVAFGALITGQTLRTALHMGFGLAQIGEFSFIIVATGLSFNLLKNEMYPIIIAVSLITTLLTPYLMRFSFVFSKAIEKFLPRRLREFLLQYANWAQKRSADIGQKTRFYRAFFKWVMLCIVVSVIFILTNEFATQYANAYFSWLIAIGLSAPFLWAMLTLFKVANINAGVVFLSRLVSIVWVGMLSTRFIPLGTALLFISLLSIALLLFFYKQMSHYYAWFENRITKNLNSKTTKKSKADLLKNLAPWDAHLVKMTVHPNAVFSGKEIAECKLRSDYGVNIVAIQRGQASIVAPKPNEKLLPFDEILTLGNDEQLTNLRKLIEDSIKLPKNLDSLHDYQLTPYVVNTSSPFLNKKIRDTQIRELCGALIVGLERQNQRIVNPDAEEKITENDVLFLVGDPTLIKKLVTQ